MLTLVLAHYQLAFHNWEFNLQMSLSKEASRISVISNMWANYSMSPRDYFVSCVHLHYMVFITKKIRSHICGILIIIAMPWNLHCHFLFASRSGKAIRTSYSISPKDFFLVSMYTDIILLICKHKESCLCSFVLYIVPMKTCTDKSILQLQPWAEQIS